MVVWGLATFHNAAFFLLFAFLGLRLDALTGLASLGDIGTLVGSSIYVLVWALLYYTSKRAVRGVELLLPHPPLPLLLKRAVQWGTVTALLLEAAVLILAFGATVLSAAVNPRAAAGFALVLIAAIPGTIVAGVLGSVFGVVLFTLDAIAIAAADAITPEGALA